ncbi:MAG: transcriptional repressor, partial [Phycisphaerae bacterium]|nr:transcriptional repressor [Phycisphaerae bacterium]NIP52598.1 transcriptional repressor [Phycisphaerae bacterium]NIS51582.1 transcriptional repressor [Phycisphaerae bacterium]NIU09167.1 transcriptional repressor [Phycisphaerae bacterium]NIU56831.1 transcriptional repressor [Phycisphaerae bacterium]
MGSRDHNLDAIAKFNRFLLQKGFRRTKQRDELVNVFLRTEKHLSTQDLFDIVRKKNRNVGYATVARTLKLLAESGLCRVVDFGDGVQRFEHKYGHEHHDHLICLECGRFVEIYSKKLEKIQDEVVKKHGYIQEYHKLDIFGLCPKC